MMTLILCAGYLAAGSIFGVVFLLFRLKRVDPAAVGASLWFRLLIYPGLVALWPVLLSRWLRGVDGPPIERTAHREAAE